MVIFHSYVKLPVGKPNNLEPDLPSFKSPPWRHGTVLQLAFGYAARIAGLALFLQRLVPERLFHTWLRCLMGSVLSGLFVGHILTHHSCRWFRDVQSVTMFNSARIQNPCRTTIPTTQDPPLHLPCPSPFLSLPSVAGFLALKEFPIQMHPQKNHIRYYHIPSLSHAEMFHLIIQLCVPPSNFRSVARHCCSTVSALF